MTRSLEHLTYLIFTINRVTSSDSTSWTTGRGSWSIVTPVSSALSVRTVSSHMARVAADTTDDVSSEVALLGAVVFAMTNLAACRCVSKRSDVRDSDTDSSGKLGSHHRVAFH